MPYLTLMKYFPADARTLCFVPLGTSISLEVGPISFARAGSPDWLSNETVFCALAGMIEANRIDSSRMIFAAGRAAVVSSD
jgi:hypothetical protein